MTPIKKNAYMLRTWKNSQGKTDIEISEYKEVRAYVVLSMDWRNS